MKRLIFCMLTLSLAGAVMAQQSHPVIHIWPGAVPGEPQPKHPPRVTPDHSKNVIRLIDVTDPTLTVYQPAEGHSNGAGIVVCPGGGYSILAINLEGTEIAQWLTTLGFTAFVLEYRVPNQQAGALQDVQRAMRYVRYHSSQWQLDPHRIGVMGFSAGGSLSARISTLYGTDWYTPVDQADSVSSKPDFAVLIYPAYLNLGPNGTLTPELKVNRDTPPMFLFQAADDHYGQSALVMGEALREAKVPFEMHIDPQGGHGYGLREGNPAADHWPALAKDWLQQYAH